MWKNKNYVYHFSNKTSFSNNILKYRKRYNYVASLFFVVKRVNIDLRKEVHSQAKIISILKSIPLNKYLESCIEKALEEDKMLLKELTSLKETKKGVEDDD